METKIIFDDYEITFGEEIESTCEFIYDHMNDNKIIKNNDADKLIIYDDTHNEASNIITYVPLKFWFNSNQSLAIPTVALQYKDNVMPSMTFGMNHNEIDRVWNQVWDEFSKTIPKPHSSPFNCVEEVD